MSDMMVAIPSRGRSRTVTRDKQTLTMLHPDILERTVLFVPLDEVDAYQRSLDNAQLSVEIMGLDYSGIAEKRKMMAQEAADRGIGKIFMIDDDINFLVRRAPDNWQLRYTEPDETVLMYTTVSEMLDQYAQVSLAAREGNNRLGLGGHNDVVECTRGMRANAFNTEEFLSLQHCRVQVMEDFDITLQLLGRGRKTAVTKYWATGQKATNTDGGCSVWRTHEIHEESARRLAELHPGVVSLRQKNNKGGGDFGQRTEVTVQWKKNYQQGLLAQRENS